MKAILTLQALSHVDFVPFYFDSFHNVHNRANNLKETLFPYLFIILIGIHSMQG